MDICLSHISKAFQGKPVIKDFSLTIESGSFTTLLGPSGCGKTTLLRMIAGLDIPDEGEIFLGKTCVYSREKGIFVPPEKRGLDEIVNQALAQVELSDFKERYPHELSGGQQQRVSFARALAYGKDCILFDEPLSALDAKLRAEMRSEIRDLVTRLHVTAVFVTHDQIEAMSMSDRIAVLSRGIIEQYDTSEIIYSHPASPFTARFVGTANWLDAHHLFRPEKGHLESREKDVFYVANVVSSQFQGQNYQIRLTRKGQTWTLPAERAMPQGSPVRICVSPDDIIEV